MPSTIGTVASGSTVSHPHFTFSGITFTQVDADGWRYAFITSAVPFFGADINVIVPGYIEYVMIGAGGAGGGSSGALSGGGGGAGGVLTGSVILTQTTQVGVASFGGAGTSASLGFPGGPTYLTDNYISPSFEIKASGGGRGGYNTVGGPGGSGGGGSGAGAGMGNLAGGASEPSGGGQGSSGGSGFASTTTTNRAGGGGGGQSSAGTNAASLTGGAGGAGWTGYPAGWATPATLPSLWPTGAKAFAAGGGGGANVTGTAGAAGSSNSGGAGGTGGTGSTAPTAGSTYGSGGGGGGIGQNRAGGDGAAGLMVLRWRL